MRVRSASSYPLSGMSMRHVPVVEALLLCLSLPTPLEPIHSHLLNTFMAKPFSCVRTPTSHLSCLARATTNCMCLFTWTVDAPMAQTRLCSLHSQHNRIMTWRRLNMAATSGTMHDANLGLVVNSMITLHYRIVIISSIVS